jgi:hypothetical protein
MSPPNQHEGHGSPAPSNKENIDNETHTKAQNRRDSFGKGILKNLNGNDTNHIAHLMQMPLRDIHVKESTSAGKKSYRRRVSFAPEVTLHKIDLIQPMPQPEEKAPRRRQTIAFAPQTAEIRHGSPIPQRSKEVEDPAEEIMYDSSDVEMEEVTHIHSSPAKTELAFEIHQDKEDYTETIDMSISRDNIEEDNEEENTMELTKPLGDIHSNGDLLLPLEENPLFLSTQGSQSIQDSQNSQSSILASSQSAFGSIKSLFDDEEEQDGEASVEMDLTQPFNHSPVNKPRSQIIDDTSDITNDSSGIEDNMDITSLADGVTERITMQNTLLNKQIHEKEDLTMDQTEIHGTINHNGGNITEEITQSMNETTIAGTTPVKKAFTHQTPLKAVRSHTSETGSPQSSKRKHQPDSDSVANDLRERINSLTPKKKRKSLLSLDRVQRPAVNSISESAPSIQLPFSSQDNHRVSFTPLRSTRGSSITAGKIEIGSFTETAPLGPAHEQSEEEPQEQQPVTLQRFLNDLSVEFFDDLNVNDDFTVELKSISKAESVRPVDFIIAKNSKLPWLELYNFSCDELQKNMNELKKLFDNLNDEFSEENPQLVKDYYETTGVIQQKRMNDRLLLMKTYSDKEAESSWYSWRFKLLDELSTRLNINSETLSEDLKKLEQSVNDINDIQKTLVKEKNDVESKLERALEKKEQVESEENSDLISLRQELINELELLSGEESQLKKLESEIEEIDLQIVDTTAIEEEIISKQSYIETNSQDPLSRLTKLLDNFEKVQMITGLKFESIDNFTLKLKIIDSEIILSLNLLDPSDRSTELPTDLPDIVRAPLNSYLLRNADLPLPELIVGLKMTYTLHKQLHDDLYYLNLAFPTKVELNDDLKIEIIEFNKQEKYKVIISIRVNKSQLLNPIALDNVEGKLIYGSTDLNAEAIINNMRKKIQNTFIENIKDLRLVKD